MDKKSLHLKKFRGNSSTSFTGRPEGESARDELKLNECDENTHQYQIIIPKGTTAFNPSFYLGLLFEGIKKLGIEKFEEKYDIVFEETQDKATIEQLDIDLYEGKRHALNEIKKKGGLMVFLKEFVN